MKITARLIAKATEYTLKQTHRWTVSFVGHDPNTGRWSGIKREYSVDEAFKVYLGGVLIAECRLTADEAKTVTEDISNWLEQKGWLPSDGFPILEVRGEVFPNYPEVTFPKALQVAIGRDANGVFFYHVAEFVSREEVPDPENEAKPLRRELWRDHTFGGGDAPRIAVGPKYIHLELYSSIEKLVRGLCVAANDERCAARTRSGRRARRR
jgi:hypothetical protein